MKGIGRRMPWTMAAFGIGALSMIGVPPTAGFVSKWFILSGAMGSANWVAVGVIVLSTVLNAAYFLPIVYNAFMVAPPEPEDGHHAHGEAPLPIVIALTATAAGTVLLFLFPGTIHELATALVASPEPATAVAGAAGR
jgi:multicomponent Na+:H+ antiporter subunit D